MNLFVKIKNERLLFFKDVKYFDYKNDNILMILLVDGSCTYFNRDFVEYFGTDDMSERVITNEQI